ncbi:MAG: tyrosine--tRNA ligase [Chloroherpetonaceae bacterium]|nr:tyrosine--tRNA ligase [Chloroherpetonaceae bacterium]
MQFPSVNEQMDLIRRNSVEIISEDELVKKIENAIISQKPLKIKLGADPSRPDLHLGHSVVLRKLRDFQDLGHHAILIIGDFTAMIGDPSGKNKTRPQLTSKETKENGKSYFDQASKILLETKTEIRYNSEWLGAMSFEAVIRLASRYTVARMLERDDFEKRYKSGEPISVHELLYPLAQAMDSVELKNDVELGGTDQKFNLLVARDIQREYGITSPQVCVTLPLLEGTDGVQKMSKTLDNYIGFHHTPNEMFQRLINIPDTLMMKYALLTGILTKDEITVLEQRINENPREAKHFLAMRITSFFHSEEDAGREKEIADGKTDSLTIFSLKDDIVVPLIDILINYGKITSKTEARRLIIQGAVSIDGEKVLDVNMLVDLTKPRTFKVGKKIMFAIFRDI